MAAECTHWRNQFCNSPLISPSIEGIMRGDERRKCILLTLDFLFFNGEEDEDDDDSTSSEESSSKEDEE